MLSLFDSFRRDPFFGDWPLAPTTSLRGTSSELANMSGFGACDVIENAKSHIVKIDVPGVDPKNLNVELHLSYQSSHPHAHDGITTH